MPTPTRRALTGAVALAAAPPLLPATFAAAAPAPPVTITVNRVDPPDQQPYPPVDRLYEYDEAAARRAHPMVELDTDDARITARTCTFFDAVRPWAGGTVTVS